MMHHQKISPQSQNLFFLRLFFFALLIMTWVAPAAAAPPHRMSGVEMTPGPRMIRAVEALANDYLAAKASLQLTSSQESRIRKEVIAFKADIWRKEAALLAMFEEVGLKRRHGLITKGTYEATNVLTGGIETDEMIRLIGSVKILQDTLSPEQKSIFQEIRRPNVTLDAPEGFNLRIGLLALKKYGRAYGEYRNDIGLTKIQQVALKVALEETRKEVIRIGTDIELSRMEAYDLLKEPIIDLKATQEAMERTATLEGVFFPNLSEYSKRFKEILTAEQVLTMKDIRSNGRRQKASGPHHGRRGEGPADQKSGSLLDQAETLGLSRTQIEQLVAVEIAAVQKRQQDDAAYRTQIIELEEHIRSNASETEIETRIEKISQLSAGIEKARLQKRVAGLKVLNLEQKVSVQTLLAKKAK